MPTVMSLDEWRSRGIVLFGEDEFQWQFICPVCGHVQCPNDFRPFMEKGANASSAYQECIGRYTGVPEFKEPGRGPCNYAGYGLFQLSPIRVAVNGKEVHAFAFAEPAS